MIFVSSESILSKLSASFDGGDDVVRLDLPVVVLEHRLLDGVDVLLEEMLMLRRVVSKG